MIVCSFAVLVLELDQLEEIFVVLGAIGDVKHYHPGCMAWALTAILFLDNIYYFWHDLVTVFLAASWTPSSCSMVAMILTGV